MIAASVLALQPIAPLSGHGPRALWAENKNWLLATRSERVIIIALTSPLPSLRTPPLLGSTFCPPPPLPPPPVPPLLLQTLRCISFLVWAAPPPRGRVLRSVAASGSWQTDGVGLGRSGRDASTRTQRAQTGAVLQERVARMESRSWSCQPTCRSFPGDYACF